MDEITPRELLINHIEHRNEIKRKRRTITLLSFLILLAIVFDLIIVAYFSVPRYQTLEVVPYEHLTLPQQPINCTLTNAEIKSMLDDFYKLKYTYYEDATITGLEGGYTEGNTITISSNLTNVEYLYALAHELTHLKYRIVDETLAEYRTIIDLIESGNTLFEQVGMNRARMIISGGMAGTEYDCGYYLRKYLQI